MLTIFPLMVFILFLWTKIDIFPNSLSIPEFKMPSKFPTIRCKVPNCKTFAYSPLNNIQVENMMNNILTTHGYSIDDKIGFNDDNSMFEYFINNTQNSKAGNKRKKVFLTQQRSSF
jgi:hypothetical protein